MFVDDGAFDQADVSCGPSETDARRLLLACVAEVERQAVGMQKLDAALGTAVAMARDPAKAAALVSTLMADLQRADLMRQELDGLSRALTLLAAAHSPNTVLPATRIHACTPLLAMQQRLLGAGAKAERA